jgi:hypothetical protein
MTNYGKYAAAVKTVQMASEQEAGGYYMSANDLHSLRLAMRDIQQILDNHKDIQAGTLKNEQGGFSPVVLLQDYGRNYLAYVYQPQAGEFTERGAIERATDAIDSKSFLSDDWTAYTNAGATMEWLEREGFGLAL